MSRRRLPIDTTNFMSKYHHPKNIAAAKPYNNTYSANGGHQWATISTPYSKSNGMYRQKQLDDEINRIRKYKQPSSSKITITIDDTTNLLRVYHYHHHCLDFELSGGRSGKGRVVWFWDIYETATDERVMKGAIAALDSSWSDPTSCNNGNNNGDGSAAASSSSINTNHNIETKAAAVAAFFQPSAGEKRKRALVATESRAKGRIKSDTNNTKATTQPINQKENSEVIDLVDDSD